MQNTTNLKLKKPNLTDAINIDDFNYNADIIDAEIKKLLDSVGNLASLNTTQKTNLVLAINEVLGKFNSIKLEAENVTITDLENLFTATKVEGALSEVMKKAKANETSILSLEKNDGDLKTLKTTEKTNLVGAINELFQNANNGKSTIATAIGSPLLSGDTFGAMGTKIDTLTQTFKNNLTAKGVTVGTTDKMSNLIDKIPNIKALSSIVPGDDVLIYSKDSFSSGNSLSIELDVSKVVFNGGYRVTFSIRKGNANTGTVRGYLQQSRGESIVFQSQNFDTSSENLMECVVDLADYRIGDALTIKGERPSGYPSVSIGKIKITTSYVIS